NMTAMIDKGRNFNLINSLHFARHQGKWQNTKVRYLDGPDALSFNKCREKRKIPKMVAIAAPKIGCESAPKKGQADLSVRLALFVHPLRGRNSLLIREVSARHLRTSH